MLAGQQRPMKKNWWKVTGQLVAAQNGWASLKYG
jgi:hypothetical protein